MNLNVFTLNPCIPINKKNWTMVKQLFKNIDVVSTAANSVLVGSVAAILLNRAPSTLNLV